MAVAPGRILGAGCIYASDRLGADGQPIDIEEIGEAPNLTITMAEEGVITDVDTCQPGSPESVREPGRLVTTVDIELKDFRGKNLARLLWGTTAELTTSTLTDHVWLAPNGTAFEVGKMYRLPNHYLNTAALTFKDAAGTPATLDPAHYTLDPVRGTFKLLNAAAYSLASLKISGAVNQVNALGEKIEVTGIANSSAKPIYIMLDGKFRYQGEVYRGITELYKVQLSPSGGIAWKSVDTFASTTMTGSALTVTERELDPIFGNVGRHTWIGVTA